MTHKKYAKPILQKTPTGTVTYSDVPPRPNESDDGEGTEEYVSVAPPAPILLPETKLTPEEQQQRLNATVQRDIEGRTEMKRLKQSMLNAQKYASSYFTPYMSLILQLRDAYEQEDEERFLERLQAFIQLAQGRTIGVIKVQQYEEQVLPILLELIAEYGIPPVARYLLPH